MAQDITFQAYSAEQGGEHPVLWGSERVQDTLGWMRDEMLELANGANLIVVDRQDIVEFNDREASPSLDTPLVSTEIPELKNVDADATVQNLRAIFNEVAPELDMSRAELENMAFGIIQNQAFAMSGENNSLNDEYGLISTPDLTVSKQGLGGRLSEAGDDASFHNIPGDAGDYIAHTMFHEAAHLGQKESDFNASYQEEPLPYEIDADVRAFQAMRENAGVNGPIHPDAIATIYEARAAGGLMQGGWHQAMDVGDGGIGAIVPGMNFPSHTSHVGIDPDSKSFTLQDMMDGNTRGDSSLPAPPEEAAQDMYATLNVNTVVNMLGGLAMPNIKHQLEQDANVDSDQYMLPEMNIKESILSGTGVDAEIAESGSTLVQMHPEVGLAALESLIENGKIEDGTSEMDYARDVIGFYHDHVEGLTEQPTYEAAKQSINDLLDQTPPGPIPLLSKPETWDADKKPDHTAKQGEPTAGTPDM